MVLAFGGGSFDDEAGEEAEKKQRVTSQVERTESLGLWQCVFVAQSGQAGKILSATLPEDLPLAAVFSWRM